MFEIVKSRGSKGPIGFAQGSSLTFMRGETKAERSTLPPPPPVEGLRRIYAEKAINYLLARGEDGATSADIRKAVEWPVKRAMKTLMSAVMQLAIVWSEGDCFGILRRIGPEIYWMAIEQDGKLFGFSHMPMPTKNGWVSSRCHKVSLGMMERPEDWKKTRSYVGWQS